MEYFALSKLRPGCRAVVVENRCDPALAARLEDLGLTLGSAVRCLHQAPAGSPIAYDICGAAIALRRRDADQILVGAEP
jgi:Fe2+ transport system protein FeoA